MTNNDISVFEQYESAVRSYCNSYPTVFSKAKGSYLIDSSGDQYIDFFSGAGALNYGHNEDDIQDAVVKYICSDGVMMSLDFHTEAKKEFIATFQKHILKTRNLDYKMQFTSPSGTSVVESAVKLARKYTGRQNVIAFTNGFHGMSGVSLSLTANSHR